MIESLIIGSGVIPEPEIPTAPGTPFQGGYYVGRMNINSSEYAIVVAPKALGERTSLSWKTSQTSTAANSLFDGLANTAAMIAAGASLHPAAEFCNNLVIDGYDDWYLPSPDELELCYRYLKPTTGPNYVSATTRPHGPNGVNPYSIPVGNAYTTTDPLQTTSDLFKGTEAFLTGVYFWTSCQSADATAWVQRFTEGRQDVYAKNVGIAVRAIRRVLVV